MIIITKIKIFQSYNIKDLQKAIDAFSETHDVVDVILTSTTTNDVYDKPLIPLVITTCVIIYKE